MSQLEVYYREASELETPDDWQAFAIKWFDQTEWPMRQPQGSNSSAPEMPRTLAADGRRWSRSSWVYDLSPEARYHYFAVLLGTGMAIRFPHLFFAKDKSASGWTQFCPFCEITTHDRGGKNCPVCSRILLDDYIED